MGDIIERQADRDGAFLAGGFGEIDRSRGAEDFTFAFYFQAVAIGGKIQRGLFEPLGADEFVDLQVCQCAGGVETNVGGARGLAQHQIDIQHPVKLAFDIGGVDAERRKRLERIASEEIGQGVGRSGQMRARHCRHEGARRRVGHTEIYVARLHAPACRKLQSAVFRLRLKFMAGKTRAGVGDAHRRQTGQELHHRIAQFKLAVNAIGGHWLVMQAGKKRCGVPIQVQSAGNDFAAA